MTLEELKLERERLIKLRDQYVNEKNALCDARDNKYMAIMNFMALASDAAIELKKDTKLLFEALCAGAVIGNNKAFGEDDLNFHMNNMDIVANNLNEIIKYCEKQIKDLNIKITSKQKTIASTNAKIKEYDSYIADKLEEIASQEENNTVSDNDKSDNSNNNDTIPKVPKGPRNNNGQYQNTLH